MTVSLSHGAPYERSHFSIFRSPSRATQLHHNEVGGAAPKPTAHCTRCSEAVIRVIHNGPFSLRSRLACWTQGSRMRLHASAVGSKSVLGTS